MGHWELLFILSFSRYMPTLSPLREQSDLGLDKPPNLHALSFAVFLHGKQNNVLRCQKAQAS